MKNYAWIWLAGAVAFLGLIGSVTPTAAFAGDDPEFQLAMSADAGAATVCTSVQLPSGRHAVQPTVDAYIAVSKTNDGGVGTIDTTKHVKIPADKLYDIWVTNDMKYICCKPAAAGSASVCKGFKYREF